MFIDFPDTGQVFGGASEAPSQSVPVRSFSTANTVTPPAAAARALNPPVDDRYPDDEELFAPPELDEAVLLDPLILSKVFLPPQLIPLAMRPPDNDNTPAIITPPGPGLRVRSTRMMARETTDIGGKGAVL